MELLVAVGGFALTLLLLISMSPLVQGTLAGRAKLSARNRAAQRHRRNTGTLWGLLVLALAYSGLLRFLHALTGIAMLDGSIGVALGLYICAHPAANGVNTLFFERDGLQHLSERAVVGWLALNLLVLLAGWMVIFIGLRQLLHGTV
jgi:hypothetical protein